MVGIAELLVVVVVLVLLTVVVLAVIRGRAAGGASETGLPACGQCGYAVRGISTLECPECGADLRKVGITSGKPRNTFLAGCLMPLLFSVVSFLIAVMLFALLETLVVPTYSSDGYALTFLPESDEYGSIDLEVDATSIIPAGQNMTTGDFTVDTINRFTAPKTTVKLYEPGTEVRVHEMRLVADPVAGPGPPRKTASFEIDPRTRQASWIDANGKPQRSKGAVSDKDVLAFLGSVGADTTNAAVISESQQVHAMVDGFLSGTHQFELEGFSSAGYSAGSTGSTGPPWFLPTYAGAWLVLWIVGLVWLARRAGKKKQGAS